MLMFSLALRPLLFHLLPWYICTGLALLLCPHPLPHQVHHQLTYLLKVYCLNMLLTRLTMMLPYQVVMLAPSVAPLAQCHTPHPPLIDEF
jgi:hypothetical protein